MTAPEVNERFSRQVILPGVGIEGQKKWGDSTILLAGEGPALEAAQTAIQSAGSCKTIFLNPESNDPLPSFSAALVVTHNPEWRRKLNRLLRLRQGKMVFAWASGSGFSVFGEDSSQGHCPCLECFEVMNPKAFSTGTPPVQRLLGSTAASEILQFILKGDSPLKNQVWVTSLDGGISFHHPVRPTYKCPARLLEEGVKVTP